MQKISLVITTIASSDNYILKKYANFCKQNSVDLIIIGDRKSPSQFKLDGSNYFSINKQISLNFRSAKLLPENHYSRKNLGYLIAIKNKANKIYETDDDNIPLKNFFNYKKGSFNKSYTFRNSGWLNVYKFFTKKNIWPRGFALEELKKKIPTKKNIVFNNSPIQQGLADLNPDVDAIYRLTNPLPIRFKNSADLVLADGSICPFNSQNTCWYEPAYPLMYLPSFCSFRMTDIWRSFIAQRIAWTCDWSILFHKPTVIQKRNEHNLMKDFGDEISGYKNNYSLMKNLIRLKLKTGPKNIKQNMFLCYEKLIDMKIINKKEIKLLVAWFKDLENIN